MNDPKICGASHDVSQAREDLNKALCALDAYLNTGYSKLLEIAQDYIMRANSKWLYSAENRFDELREKMMEETNHE